MKTYPFILVDKNDMTKLRHFPTAQRCADAMYGKTGPQVIQSYVVVRDEKVVVDFSELAHLTALPVDVHSRILQILTSQP